MLNPATAATQVHTLATASIDAIQLPAQGPDEFQNYVGITSRLYQSNQSLRLLNACVT